MALGRTVSAGSSPSTPGERPHLHIAYGGDLGDLELAPVTTPPEGLLEKVLTEAVNIVNAPGDHAESRHQGDGGQHLRVRGYTGLSRSPFSRTGILQWRDGVSRAGVPDRRHRRVPHGTPLEGRMLLISNYDRPGVIASSAPPWEATR